MCVPAVAFTETGLFRYVNPSIIISSNPNKPFESAFQYFQLTITYTGLSGK